MEDYSDQEYFEEEEFYEEEDGEINDNPNEEEMPFSDLTGNIPQTFEDEQKEIEYYAKKLGLDEGNDWDDYLIQNGYAKILEGISVSESSKPKKKVELVKAVRTEEEEAARRDFTGLLNRISPSNFGLISSRIREAFVSHPHAISVAQFSRCISQRILSDAPLPDLFIQTYAKSLKDIPDAIEPTLKAIKTDKSPTQNVNSFLQALGEDTVNFYTSTDTTAKSIDKEVAQLATIARQMHMTTDVRRSVFYALTTAVDVPDAFSKVAKLQLSKSQRKDVPLVIIECCRNEASYNPYYSAVSAHFAENDPKFTKSLISAIKSTLKLSTDFSSPQLRNAGLFISDLAKQAVINFGFLKGDSLLKHTEKQQMLIMIFLRDFFLKAELGIIDDEVTSISSSPNFAKDLSKFIQKRILTFAAKSTEFTQEREKIIQKVILKLNKE